MTTIALSLHHLHAATFTASDEKTRYCLNGVCIDRDKDGKVLLVSTDGHVMSVRLVDADCPDKLRGKIVSRASIEAIWRLASARTRRGKDTLVVSSEDGGRLKLADGAVLGQCFIDATFPDWRRVVPPPPYAEGPRGQFNRKLLELLAKSAEAQTIRLYGIDGPDAAHGAHLVRSPKDDWLGVLMPHRDGAKANFLPDWMRCR